MNPYTVHKSWSYYRIMSWYRDKGIRYNFELKNEFKK